MRIFARVMKRVVIATSLVMGVGAQNAIAQSAANYPSRPITLVVAYAPGGTTDVMARALAQAMGNALGQQVVVDNKSGAGGVVGTKAVAVAPPDGYTIGFGTSSQLVINPGVHKLDFDIDRDLQMVGLVARFPMVLYGARTGPQNLVDLAKVGLQAPGKLTYGSGGVGQIGHISGAMLMSRLGVAATHVPYRSAGQVLPEIMAGRLDLMMDTLVTGMPLVKDGKLSLLAVGGPKRSAMAPDVPTFEEQGIKDFTPYSWTSVFVPAKVPPAVIDKLNAAVNSAVASEAFQTMIARQGGTSLAPASPREAADFGVKERKVWVPFTKALDIKPE